MKQNATLHFKTDNNDLFDYSIESIKNYPMNITFLTRDLHQESIENVMTEFEEKFSKLNIRINKCIAHFKEDIDG
jgi:tRNA (guanine-N7-)-methyltransferase